MIVVQPPQLDYFESFTRLDLASFGKVEVATSVPSLWMDRPWALAIGVGPGTFSSRAFRTFADLPYRGGGDDVSYGLLGATYRTRLADEFVVPILEKPEWQLGSGTADGPFTSYVSLAAESGLLGLAAISAIYLSTWHRLVRFARVTPDPDRRAVALLGSVALLLLLAASLLDNYLEQTRSATLAWFLVAMGWRSMLDQAHLAVVADRHRSADAQSSVV